MKHSPTLNWTAYLLSALGGLRLRTMAGFFLLGVPLLLTLLILRGTWVFSHDSLALFQNLYHSSRWSMETSHFLHPWFLDTILGVAWSMGIAVGMALYNPADSCSFWRTRPVSRRHLLAAMGLVIGAWTLFHGIALPLLIARILELPWTALLHWMAFRVAGLLLVQLLFVALAISAMWRKKSPNPLAFGFSALFLSLPCYGLFFGIFRSEGIPWHLSALGFLWVGALSLLAILRAHCFQKIVRYRWLLLGAWLPVALLLIGHLWISSNEVLFESSLTMSIHPGTSFHDSEGKYEPLATVIPNPFTPQGTVWDSTEYRTSPQGPWERKSHGILTAQNTQSLVSALAAQMDIKFPEESTPRNSIPEGHPAEFVLPRAAPENFLQLRLEEFALVKLADTSVVQSSRQQSANGTTFVAPYARGIPRIMFSRFATPTAPEPKSSIGCLWNPETGKIYSLNHTMQQKSRSWLGLVATFGDFEQAEFPGNADTWPPGTRFTLFALEPTGRKAVKTFHRDGTGAWQPAGQ